MTKDAGLTFRPGMAMPAREPLDMPVQRLRKAPAGVRFDAIDSRVAIARLITFVGAILLLGYGIEEMIEVVSPGGITILEWIMTGLFAITFGWIAMAATTALAGALMPPRRVSRELPPEGLKSRTALVMPVYHEDPIRTTATLRTMAEDIAAKGVAHAFEIVILSDSTDPDSWIRETIAVGRLAEQLSGVMPVWYRRRWFNTAKKAGNIKDFVEQWGGRYDHMLVLDADSLMTAETLIALAAGMEADPRLGILQTVPALAGGTSVFARMQQFAGRIHGPIVARGLASWSGSDGNYWGHNAIIRTAAFAACCGLPELPGRKPFGGPIMSHDFVEAALMRRAGWRVEMANDLFGSWEESPPSLIDVAVRDRRWAQGNLQHASVIPTRGFVWASRMHFITGIMSYLASPLWLALIIAGLSLSAQAQFIRPEYFSSNFQLFPTWPSFDSARMIRLFMLTMLVLFLPKIFGMVRAMFHRDLRRAAGGPIGLVVSVLVEIILSALYAPVMMLVHTRHVIDILAGRDSGWSAQRRNAQTGWGEAWFHHRWHTLFGVFLMLVCVLLTPAILAWLSPVLLGLIFSIPLSLISGSSRLGGAMRRLTLLRIPEEAFPDAIFARREELEAEAPPLPVDAIAAIATDETSRNLHFERSTPAPPRKRGEPEADYLTAAEKIREGNDLEEVLGWLHRKERLHIASSRILVEQLSALPRDGRSHNATAGEALPHPVSPAPSAEIGPSSVVTAAQA
ncbi:membrane glycosyltransferase [Faunimonas pinastri]|uniref:Glucans biosynthesis glucosyltransferase H n=1 Tax=Faunimonas pinastri TaxID=1855383 RepID=A0A1H9ACE7_9HYPH|nr:glucans biosynthesis glucosyltransferase MdoH [Faunimonas pinastri]SEP74339.1 membrane glycosyltransferase [Faunimonas pinastri]